MLQQGSNLQGFAWKYLKMKPGITNLRSLKEINLVTPGQIESRAKRPFY